MTNTSETGHAKNVANLEDLISFCTSYGTAYNPSKNNIKLVQLNTLRTNAINVLQVVKTTKATLDNATNNREVAFSNLKKLATKVVNALEATDAKKQTVDDTKTIQKKLNGKRASEAKTITNADGTTQVAKTISVSQQSFDGLIENFSKLVQTVSIEPLYIPNETELKVATLNTFLTNLKTTNTAVINAYTNYSNARINRDLVLYADNTGVKDIVQDVKKYIKSVFGTSSAQHKQLATLKFTKPR